MKLHRFVDLGINSSKKPKYSWAWIETEGYGIYFLDSTSNLRILKTIDKGKNVSTVSTRSHPVRAFWYDRANDLIYFSELPNAALNKYVYSIDLADSDNITQVYNWIVGEFGADHPFIDLALHGGEIYTLMQEDGGLGNNFYRTTDGSNGWNTALDGNTTWNRGVTLIVIIGAYLYFAHEDNQSTEDNSDNTIWIWKWEIGTANFTKLEESSIGYGIPTNLNQLTMTYDGLDILQWIVFKYSDNKNYLMRYSIGNNIITIGAEYNVILMLDRYNIGTAPNELEKGFEVNGLKIYEIKPRRGGLVLLQDLSSFPSTSGKHIIAISDNFIMLEDD